MFFIRYSKPIEKENILSMGINNVKN